MKWVHKDEVYTWVGVVDDERGQASKRSFPRQYMQVPDDLADELEAAWARVFIVTEKISERAE